MFDSLSAAFQNLFRSLRGRGTLTEENIREALREVRTALLEADVPFDVVKGFTDRVRTRALGQEVLHHLTPGQQFIRYVHEEMAALLGGTAEDLVMAGSPGTLLLCGLHGSGKTTTAGKLARWLSARRGRRVLMVAGDLRRPAAADQLAILAEQAGAAVLRPNPGETLADFGPRALVHARSVGCDFVIFDTGGRFQMEADLIAELRDLRQAVKPANVVLVVDSAMGQESVRVAEGFHRALGLTGLILTKLDGDARGGAALSIRSVTGCPVLFTGTGEKLDQLEPFHPDRMASRILGMGDVLSLVEKAQEVVDEQAARDLERKIRRNDFTLEDFLLQFRQMKRMGPLEKVLEMIPGGSTLVGNREAAEEMKRFAKKAEAIILSMTPRERRHPEILNGSRRARIARGSGTTPQDVNEVLRQFKQAKGMAQRLSQMQKRLRIRM